jgi:hypothetical protein
MDARDGKLAEGELDEIRAFIQSNPEFEEYLEDLPVCVADSSVFDKNVLYRYQVTNVYAYSELNELFEDKLIVGNIEGILNEEEKDSLRFKTSDAVFNRSMAYYQATKLVSDSSIVFKNKQALLRKTPFIIPRIRVLAGLAAASAAIVLYFSISTTENRQTLAKNPNKTKSALEHIALTKKDSSMDYNSRPEVLGEDRPRINEYIEPSTLSSIDTNQNITIKNILPSVPPSASESPILAVNEQKLDLPLKAIQHQPALEKKEYKNIWAFVKGKFKQAFFCNEQITTDEQVSEITRKLSEQTGLDMAYDRSRSSTHEVFFLKLGAISVERKRSN